MIEVIIPGLFSTVQDSGRQGYQAFGLPVAGAMDSYAYTVVNLLVGNYPGAAVLEMTMLGGQFRFLESLRIAIGGAEMNAALDGQPIENWSAFVVQPGSVLSFGTAQSGCRAYLAVHGGIDTPPVMGSRSTYTRANIGGHEGRQLRPGDRLKTGGAYQSQEFTVKLPQQFKPIYESRTTIRVMLGPQDDLFTAAGRETLFAAPYGITDEADRMGYRLEGTAIEHVEKADIVSDALPLGAIQVPGHGQPIVMMADRQTTGGYAKIGVVISTDISKLAQAKPGDSVQFISCSQTEAVAALRQRQEQYEEIAAYIQQRSLLPPQTTTGRLFLVSVNGQQYRVQVEER